MRLKLPWKISPPSCPLGEEKLAVYVPVPPVIRPVDAEVIEQFGHAGIWKGPYVALCLYPFQVRT